MKRLAIYHPGTGTLIDLTDKTYLVDLDFVKPKVLEALQNGATLEEREHCGFRLDNYNMTNLFYGGLT